MAAGATPREGRQRLAHVLAGRAGRDIRWSLNAARTDLWYGVGCHLPITGLRASASRIVGQKRSPFQTHSPFLPRRCADAIGICGARIRAVNARAAGQVRRRRGAAARLLGRRAAPSPPACSRRCTARPLPHPLPRPAPPRARGARRARRSRPRPRRRRGVTPRAASLPPRAWPIIGAPRRPSPARPMPRGRSPGGASRRATRPSRRGARHPGCRRPGAGGSTLTGESGRRTPARGRLPP
jgi:hypothetical protein